MGDSMSLISTRRIPDIYSHSKGGGKQSFWSIIYLNSYSYHVPSSYWASEMEMRQVMNLVLI